MPPPWIGTGEWPFVPSANQTSRLFPRIKRKRQFVVLGVCRSPREAILPLAFGMRFEKPVFPIVRRPPPWKGAWPFLLMRRQTSENASPVPPPYPKLLLSW